MAHVVAENLKSVLRGMNLTQKEAANRCGIPETTMSRLLHTNREPRLATLRKVADGLGIPVTYITGDRPKAWIDPQVQAFFEQHWTDLSPEAQELVHATIKMLTTTIIDNHKQRR